MSMSLDQMFSKAKAAQRAARQAARQAKVVAETESYMAGNRRHQAIIAAVAAITTPAIARAVARDQRVVRLCNNPTLAEELTQTLVWAPAQPEKINSTLSAIFGHGGVLDQLA